MPRYIDADKLTGEFEWILNQQNRFNRAETEDVLERIRKMPTEDVAPIVHAHWRNYPDCGVTRCSLCDWSIEEAWYSDYCPNCGAKMDEMEEGTKHDCK